MLRAWKLHFCWALLAMGTAVAWGRWTESQRETVVRGREAAVGIRNPSLSENPADAAPPAAAPPPPAGSTPLVRLPAGFHLLPDPNDLPVDEIRRLLKSPDFRELYKALGPVVHLKDPALKRELLLELLRCPNPQIRSMVMTNLPDALGDEAVTVLHGLLQSDPENSIRVHAVEILGSLPDKGSAELLLSVYRDGDQRMKIAAAASLYRFGHFGEAAEMLGLLASGLDSSDGALRKEAVEGIAQLKAPIAIPTLARVLRDSSGDVRAQAALALGDIDAPEVVLLLEPLLKDPYADVREYAQDAIDNYNSRHPK